MMEKLKEDWLVWMTAKMNLMGLQKPLWGEMEKVLWTALKKVDLRVGVKVGMKAGMREIQTASMMVG